MANIVRQFGKQVREVRLQKNMSQGALAKKLHTHPTYVSAIERGVRNPSLLTIQRIAKALGVALKDLL